MKKQRQNQSQSQRQSQRQPQSHDHGGTSDIGTVKVSRKQFLGLIGSVAGSALLPAPARAEPEAATPAELLPLVSNRKTRISFRYFLPWAPAWGDQAFANQRLDELLQFAGESGIDSVQFFVNTFRHSYYVLPVDADSQKQWIDWMRDRVAPRIRNAGLGFELNFQQLLGATTSNTDLRALYKWKQFMVDHYGVTSQGSPCPLDPIYRREMAAMLQGWATTMPDILWIDDDFRLHNHSTAGMYCYCPLHLAEFSQRIGKSYTREALLTQVLKPGPAGELRLRWLDYLGDTMAEFATWIRQQIQSQSPRTRVALMTSGTDIHSLEGRDWKKTLGNFAGTFKPLIRPTFGLYTGTTAPPKSASSSLTSLLSQVQVVEQSLGENNCDFAPELENTRYTTWAKSVAHSTYSLLLGQLIGLPMITTAINDLDGSPISEEPTTVGLLRNARPQMEAIAALNLKPWTLHGLLCLCDKDIARKTPLPERADFFDMTPSVKLESVFAQMGIPLRYLTPTSAGLSASDKGSVILLESATVWLATDGELQAMLAGGVLLTSAAARVMIDRGFADLIGVRVNRHRKQGIQSEEYVPGLLPGVTASRVPHRGADWDELVTDNANTKVASWFCDMLGEKHIGSSIFTNSLGGRVGVYAQNSDMQGGLFASHARLRWLHGVLLWLSNGQFPALPVLRQHGLSLLKKSAQRQLYAFCNLGTDPLSTLSIRWPGAEKVRSIRVLQIDGTWQSPPFKVVPDTLSIPANLNCYQWIVLLLDP